MAGELLTNSIYKYLCRIAATMSCNILCLIWILLLVRLFGSDHETLHVFVLASADTFISVSLLIMAIYNHCIKTHTEGCEQIQLSQPPDLSPDSLYDVTYHTVCQEQDHFAPTAPQDNLAPTAPQDNLAPTAKSLLYFL